MCPPRDQLLLDPTFRDSDEILRTESLLAGRDVVPLAGEEIKGTCDRLEVQAAAEPHELALGQVVLLEELADRLQLQRPGMSSGSSYQLSKHPDPPPRPINGASLVAGIRR